MVSCGPEEGAKVLCISGYFMFLVGIFSCNVSVVEGDRLALYSLTLDQHALWLEVDSIIEEHTGCSLRQID